MPSFGVWTALRRIITAGFDLFILCLLFIWLCGGVPFQGHLYLKHGADPRRAAILLGILGYFCYPRLREKSFILRSVNSIGLLLARPKLRWGLYALSFIYALLLNILQTLALRVPLWDVGIFHQIFWGIKNHLGFHSTISGAGDFLTDHFSPSIAGVVPFFYLFGESPFFLPIFQVFCLFGGCAAWIYLAERAPGASLAFRMKLATATLIFVLSFDSLWGNLRWGFHENALGFLCISWALTFVFVQNSHISFYLRRYKELLILILFLIAAFSKEILLLDVAIGLGIWAIYQQNRYFFSRMGFASVSAGFSIILVLKFIYFEKMPHPVGKNYFSRYYSYLGNNLETFLHTLFFAPQNIIHAVGASQLVHYFFVVFSPWLFLPLVALFNPKKAPVSVWLGMIIPSFLSAALATYSPLRDSHFHYVLELWPALASITIVLLAQKCSPNWIWAWVLFALVRMDHDPLADLRGYWSEARQISSVRTAFRAIPLEASVSADELVGPWLAGRKWITRWPDVALLPGQCPEYIVKNVIHEDKQFNQELQLVLSGCQVGHPDVQASLVLKVQSWMIYRLR